MFKRKANISPAFKKKGPLDNQIRNFGIPLEDLVQRSGVEVPTIVVKICEYLTDTALDLEGIFRVNGNSRTIDNLKHSFDSIPDVDLNQFNDGYAVAGLLKLFLRELPSGLIPEGSTIEFTEIMDAFKDDINTCLSEMEALLSSLPVDNYNLLKYLCQFLCKVANNEYENKMSPTSLGIVFGPNVFRCGGDFEGLRNQGSTNGIMSLFIQYFQSLFKMAAPSHANIIQVKEYSRDQYQTPKILQSKSSGNSKSDDNSMESPRPKPRLSLQVPTANDVRFSTRISDEDFRAGSPYSMDTENDWSLVSPRVSVDLSSGLQQAIRQCVTEHLFGPLLVTANMTASVTSAASTTTPASAHQREVQEDEEATVSGTSESIAPTPSPRVVRPVNGSATLPDRRSQQTSSVNSSIQQQHQNHPASSGYSSATLPHDSPMHVDDLDWPPQQQGRRERRHSAEIMEDNENSPSANKVASSKTNTTNSRTRTGSRKPKLAFQDTSADEVSGGHDSIGNVPILDLSGNPYVHNDAGNSYSPHGDIAQSTKPGITLDDQSDVLRTTTKRIQILKRNIRHFEESYELEHGWKPGQSQKNAVEDVRQWSLQLAEARRQLKSLKSGATLSSTVSISATSKPGTTAGTTITSSNVATTVASNSCPNSTRPLSAVSDVSGSGIGALQLDSGLRSSTGGHHYSRHQHASMPATTEEDDEGVVLPTAGGGTQTVEETYDRLISRLAEKRVQAGRDDVLANMTRDQVEGEKLAIQKALLYFESYHGRPNDRHEKLVMKPLYDRYRQVKRLLQGGDSTTPTIERVGGTLESTDTLQRSATIGGRHVINIPTAGGAGGSATLGGGGTTDFMVTQDWGLLKGDRHFEVTREGGGGGGNSGISGGGGALVRLTAGPEEPTASNGKNRAHSSKMQTMGSYTGNSATSNTDISNKSVSEIVEEQKTVKEEKRTLQKVLKDFEHDFQKETGHKVNSEDRLPMRAEYNRYKQIKARLKLIDTLLSKKSTI